MILGTCNKFYDDYIGAKYIKFNHYISKHNDDCFFHCFYINSNGMMESTFFTFNILFQVSRHYVYKYETI